MSVTQSSTTSSANAHGSLGQSSFDHTVTMDHEKKYTVQDYVQDINTPYKLSNTVQRPLRIELHNPSPNSLRIALLQKDSDKLKDALNIMTSTKNFDVLKDLAKQEISLYVNLLIKEQQELLNLKTQMRFPLDRKRTKALHDETLLYTKQIYQLSRYLLTNGQLCFSDAIQVLQMLARNQEFNYASIWIMMLDNSGTNQSVSYQNLRLEILGKTSPKLSAKPYKRAANSTFINGDSQWNSLLNEYLSNSNGSPNLQTHKILISGLSKFGSLKQIEDHVYRIWGISSSLNDSENIILPKSSSLYPDDELLEILISAYSSNRNLEGVFPILAKFEKVYDFQLSKSKLLWRVMLHCIDSDYPVQNLEERTRIFNNVWSLMEKKQVNFSTRLYTQRLNFLKESDDLTSALNDLPRIFKHHNLQFSKIEAMRIEKLMFRYLKFITRSIYSQDLDSDETVTRLINVYSVSQLQKEALFQEIDIIKGDILENQKQFDELQKQYDQEEDEDSLW